MPDTTDPASKLYAVQTGWRMCAEDSGLLKQAAPLPQNHRISRTCHRSPVFMEMSSRGRKRISVPLNNVFPRRIISAITVCTKIFMHNHLLWSSSLQYIFCNVLLHCHRPHNSTAYQVNQTLLVLPDKPPNVVLSNAVWSVHAWANNFRCNVTE